MGPPSGFPYLLYSFHFHFMNGIVPVSSFSLVNITSKTTVLNYICQWIVLLIKVWSGCSFEKHTRTPSILLIKLYLRNHNHLPSLVLCQCYIFNVVVAVVTASRWQQTVLFLSNLNSKERANYPNTWKLRFFLCFPHLFATSTFSWTLQLRRIRCAASGETFNSRNTVSFLFSNHSF